MIVEFYISKMKKKLIVLVHDFGNVIYIYIYTNVIIHWSKQIIVPNVETEFGCKLM